ncbi:hypothetical protein Hanom_Chr10g00961591 [Helianthus anomalus]
MTKLPFIFFKYIKTKQPPNPPTPHTPFSLFPPTVKQYAITPPEPVEFVFLIFIILIVQLFKQIIPKSCSSSSATTSFYCASGNGSRSIPRSDSMYSKGGGYGGRSPIVNECITKEMRLHGIRMETSSCATRIILDGGGSEIGYLWCRWVVVNGGGGGGGGQRERWGWG